MDPIYEPKEKFLSLNIPYKFLKYYQHNEVSKFKHTYRKDTKLNEEDATLWWLKEKIVTIKNPLPNIINFYPIDPENIILSDISPVRSAINNVREQYEKLKVNLDGIKSDKKICDEHTRLIQGTVDAGVNGGLPKYQKFFAEEYLSENPDLGEAIEELKNLIYETIEFAESYLYWCGKYLPNNPLLMNLEQEQLPKLKAKFSITTINIRQMRTNLCENNTPRQNSSQSSLHTQISDCTPSKVSAKVSVDSSQTTPKSSHGKAYLTKLSNTSNRESLSSIRSNSEEDVKQKYILEEPINPKRPLRPSRINSNNNSSGSNQSSRPASHISDDGLSLSVLPNSTIDLIYDSKNNAESSFLSTPPPKPPRTNKKVPKENDTQLKDDTSMNSPKNVIFRNNN